MSQQLVPALLVSTVTRMNTTSMLKEQTQMHLQHFDIQTRANPPPPWGPVDCHEAPHHGLYMCYMFVYRVIAIVGERKI